jgi:hypothetical protein
MMLEHIYAKDGPWDQFAGKDGQMTFDEAQKMDAAIRGEMHKMGIDMPKMKDGSFKRFYTAYDALSEGDGFNKKDARKADNIQEAIRKHLVNWKPTKEQRKAFRPIFKSEVERYEAMKEDSKMRQFYERWMNHKAEKEMKKMNKELYKEGGVFDQFAGKDHMMNIDEAK